MPFPIPIPGFIIQFGNSKGMKHMPPAFCRNLNVIMGLNPTPDKDPYPRYVYMLSCVCRGVDVSMGRSRVLGIPSAAHEKKRQEYEL
jgi:hypothetical protein